MLVFVFPLFPLSRSLRTQHQRLRGDRMEAGKALVSYRVNREAWQGRTMAQQHGRTQGHNHDVVGDGGEARELRGSRGSLCGQKWLTLSKNKDYCRREAHEQQSQHRPGSRSLLFLLLT